MYVAFLEAGFSVLKAEKSHRMPNMTNAVADL